MSKVPGNTNSSIDNSPDFFFAIDVEVQGFFRFASVNQLFLDVLGVKAPQVIGKLIEEVLPESSRSLVLEKCRQAISERRAVNWLEAPIHPYNDINCEVTVVPVFDDRGRCNQLVGTIARSS